MNNDDIKSAIARKGYKILPYQLDVITKTASKVISILCGCTQMVLSADDALMVLDIARSIIKMGAANESDNA
ncbi:MAG: hypothetical protein ACI4NU_09730 [Christensenellales bacterium]